MITVVCSVHERHASVRITRHNYRVRPAREWVLLTDRVELPPGLGGRGAVVRVLRDLADEIDAELRSSSASRLTPARLEDPPGS